ncbi:MAG: hypothetical protein WKF52_06790 [Sphingomicrobium sp.]
MAGVRNGVESGHSVILTIATWLYGGELDPLVHPASPLRPTQRVNVDASNEYPVKADVPRFQFLLKLAYPQPRRGHRAQICGNEQIDFAAGVYGAKVNRLIWGDDQPVPALVQWQLGRLRTLRGWLQRSARSEKQT